MSTLETTISLLQGLSESELLAIQGVAREFIAKGEKSYIFKPQTEEELLERIDASIESARKDNYMDAKVSVDVLRKEFGL